MGLEIVEIILRVEEEFEIEIRDEEAEQASTPGALARLVSWKLGALDGPGCLSSAAFYQTRRVLMALTSTPRAGIRPRTPLDTLLPLRSRRASWAQLKQQLGQQSGAVLPDLALPERLKRAIFLGAAASAMLGLGCYAAGEARMSIALFGGGAAYLWLAFALLKPWARQLPASCQSAGQLSHFVLVSRLRSASATPVEVRASEIWHLVQALIADELDMPLEKVTPDADFVRDLGLG